ncbi:hypothetical protein COCNU_01G006200 [Cocos nucifera]|uniref:Uncharacterized protein n=1 Tax=Cocos nucifera TaxID=13894 RepID=A0A8K0HU75_COCNU|nr:hypothetical protein COCNU_01G006200 [Cocos nucifera]
MAVQKNLMVRIKKMPWGTGFLHLLRVTGGLVQTTKNIAEMVDHHVAKSAACGLSKLSVQLQVDRAVRFRN